MSCQRKYLFVIVILALASSGNASPLFDDDAVLEISLAGPLGSLIEASDDTMQAPFSLSANGVEHAIEVRVRGKSRRKVCDIPPLRFNFAKKSTADTVFAGQDKIKFVTHCNDNDASQVDTLEEYAAYKIFSLLSNVSYKVRLLRVTYTDTDNPVNDAAFTGYGFLIEPTAELAKRINGEAVDITGVVLNSLNARQAATVYIFQYMIGNTDWSMIMADADDTCCHNGDLLEIDSSLYYVPYDFDLAGLVNARYAKPDPSLRMSSVLRRRYRGYCISTAELQAALAAIRERKEDVLNVIRGLPGLSEKNRDAKLKYLEGFFDQAREEARLVRSFDRRCL